MKRHMTFVALLCAALLLCACASSASTSESVAYDTASSDSFSESYSEEEYTGSSNASVSTQEPADSDTRKIIYTADMSIVADDPAQALSVICDKAISLGGYIAASYTRNDDEGAYRSSATLKVPAESLDELVGAAKDTGTLSSYQLSSDDISLSYYDLQARLSNAQAEEAQLLELLKTCEDIEDVLAVRAQLTDVRSDIESYQAQINLWDNLVDYATLELSITRTEKTPVEGENTLIEIWKASDVFKRIGSGFANSARFTVNAVGAIGIFLAYALIPCAVLFCCIGLPIILHQKKKRARKAAQLQSAPDQPVQEPNAQQNDSHKQA